MPRLVERIQAAAASTTAVTAASTTTTSASPTTMGNLGTGQMVLPHGVIGNDFGGAQVTPSYTPENSSTAASSDSFGNQVSPVSDLTDYYSNIQVNNPNPNYFQASQVGYSDSSSLISPFGNYYNDGIDFQSLEQNNPWLDGGDASDNFLNAEDFLFLQQQFNFNMWKYLPIY